MGIFSSGISPELKTFLEAEDLDDLMEARSKLWQLDEKDIKKIRFILQKWNSPQAVSNLLFHPFLIPEDLRASCLLRGLREKKEPYYILASIVGLQGVDPTVFPKEQRKTIKEYLISVLKVSEGIISARASVTIYDYLSLEDASTAFELLSHPNEAVRHNILCWLIRTIEESDPGTFISIANSSNIPEDTRKEAIKKFQEHLRQKEIGECSLFGTQLYAYIPNLKEM
ncbi:hypothetical protein RSJ42_06955 [Methanosarcina hadiensis]|uniref:hypothetical protein n=1 Tax=Methanosarcina hadiensis TaxID=3078083 RepID=UPI003977329D